MTRIAGQFDFFARRNGLMRFPLPDDRELGAAVTELAGGYLDPLEALAEHARGHGLGWLTLPAAAGADQSIVTAQQLREHCEELIVCGIGGSVLGTQAVYSALNLPGSGLRRLHFLDNIDPAQSVAMLAAINPDTTGLCIVTKSGGTLETLASFALLLNTLEQAGLDATAIAERVVIITGTHPSSLRAMADANHWTVLPIPPDVGGRFSVLSPVGILPLAFAGVDIDSLLVGARRIQEETTQKAGSDNQALRLACTHFLAHTQLGCTQTVQYVYGDPLLPLAYWWRQLWAECLGKATRLDGRPSAGGQTPQIARGATDQHSQNQLYLDGPADKLYCLLGAERWGLEQQLAASNLPGAAETFRTVAGRGVGELLAASMLGTRDALIERGRPLYELQFTEVDAASIGAYLQFWMLTTALGGLLYGVNPFDQPAVELGKKLIKKRL